MIQIKENVNDVDEFNLLYDSVGWGAYDKKITEKAKNENKEEKLTKVVLNWYIPPY